MCQYNIYFFLQEELWEKLTSSLNSAGCGPQKLPKEWAKVSKEKNIYKIIVVSICIVVSSKLYP